MAESQKKVAPIKSEGKISLLDLDVDKDLLGSWKSMSMGDDGSDFDFGPSASGKKKAFKFDKMDMDFSIEADFDKLSSFKMDMPSLDIASPTKKSGTSKERSKEASSGGEHQSKRDSFPFSFDIDEFADLDFGPKKAKTGDNSNKSKDKEGFLNTTGSGDSGDLLAKHVDASEDDDISLKHSASKSVSISEVDTQMENIKASEAKHVDASESKRVDASEDDDISFKHSATSGVTILKVDTKVENIKDPAPRNEDARLKSVGDERCLLKPETAKEQDIQKTISSEKIMSCSLQEPIQESHALEHVVALRSDVHPSSSIKQSNKNLLRNSQNPGVQVKSMTSTRNTRKIIVEKNRTSPTQADMRISEVSTLRVSRATEPKLKPLNSVLLKGLTSMRNKDQGMELQVNMSKRNLSVDTNKQTPRTPTLKRKSFEGSSETPRLTPLKRLSPSPYRASSEKAVEEQVRKHASVVNEKSPSLGIPLTEMDISSEIENDSNFEKAEPCSKELEDEREIMADMFLNTDL